VGFIRTASLSDRLNGTNSVSSYIYLVIKSHRLLRRRAGKQYLQRLTMKIWHVFPAAMSFACFFFMGLVFFTESFLQRPVLYMEPNLFVAKIELALVVFGAFSLFYHFLVELKPLQ
jgi:hypothetical protein